MRSSLGRSGLAALMTIGLITSVAASAVAQTRGQITDEWDNPLEGATVQAEAEGAGGSQSTTTDEDGEFMFVGLATGDWSFTTTLDGYQGIWHITSVRQLTARPLSFELAVLPSGGRFRERTEFEAADGQLAFRFEEDGTFEFEDTNGEGEGTYGIVELNAVLIVRDYDGPDDKFDIMTPVVLEFSDEMFTPSRVKTQEKVV